MKKLISLLMSVIMLFQLSVQVFAAYTEDRASTDQEEQESSYEAQIGYYTEKINSNAEWQMAGIFADV